ncbi:hypothetical protein Tco_1499805 [Tanacetum coccineum]
MDLFYLYCIYGDGVICNIPYWLARYLRGIRDKDLICGGMFLTRLARSFGMLTSELLDVLSVEPWKRISDKRMKNQAKTDKTEHGMEEREKDKVKSKPKSKKVKVNPEKSKVKPEAVTEEYLMGPPEPI